MGLAGAGAGGTSLAGEVGEGTAVGAGGERCVGAGPVDPGLVGKSSWKIQDAYSCSVQLTDIARIV